MRTKLFFVTMLALFSLPGNMLLAQTEKPVGGLDESSVVIQAGIGLGDYSYANASGTPLLSLSFEKGLGNRLGPGYIGVGGYIGYKTSSYKFNAGGDKYRWRYTDLLVAARAAYHPDFAHTEQLDVYGGVALGLNFYRFSSNDNILGNSTNTNVVYSGYVGARYLFTENIGAYAELGWGLGILNLGVVFGL